MKKTFNSRLTLISYDNINENTQTIIQKMQKLIKSSQ